jgi:hypothetical protein
VFTAITVVLTTSLARSKEARGELIRRSYALQLFASAFIVLALDSYFASITAGELACNRAYAESVLSGGILGDGAILMITGLGWLIVTYSIPAEGLETILSYINWGVWVVIIIVLAISGIDVGEAMLPGHPQVIVNALPIILGIGMTVLVIVVERHSRQLSDAAVARWVRYAALSGLAAAIVAGLFTGIVSGFGAEWWVNPPPVAVYVVVTLSMLIPAVPLLSSIPPATAARSAARRPPNEDGDGGGQNRRGRAAAAEPSS